MVINLIIILLIINNIDFIKIAGKNFVAATFGATSPACTDADDGAYFFGPPITASQTPCCKLSCGCVSGGAGCSKCCPNPMDATLRYYFCDANDPGFVQCFYCTVCTGGSAIRCSAQESNECDSNCGVESSCDDKTANTTTCTGNIDTGGYCSKDCAYTPTDNKCEVECTGYSGIAECDEQSADANISYCNKAGSPSIADSCSATCGGQDRTGENICRSATFAVGCTAEAACNGLTRNSCNNNVVYCDENCLSSSGLGADDNSNGIDNGCEELCDNKDNDNDGLIDEDLTRACQDFTLGVCTASTQVCTAGSWGTCLAKTSEVCWDNIDNDCDGSTDCMDPDCLGKTDSSSHTCCRDASGPQNSSCPTSTGCVYTGCSDDNTKSGSSADSFCGDSGFCVYNNISCNSDCASNGCCYPNATQGVSVCSNEKDILNVDDEASKEICCASDWKGANCAGLTCTSTDSINHDCCAFNDCPAMTPGNCGVAGCNNYACAINQSTSLCTGLEKGTCGVAAGNCTAISQGWYNSYTCDYKIDNNKCSDPSLYCKCSGDSCDCESACGTLCAVDCEYCYSACTASAGEPKDKNSCVKHGCWSECVT